MNSLLNILIGIVLTVLALPFSLIIALIIKSKGDGPVLHRGKRLGFNKKIFTMYKFRTLNSAAEEATHKEIFTPSLGARIKGITAFGKFLRDTRLDELPQLFNILKRQMDLVGPRPERPEIYERFCKHIPGYDERFKTRPGLVGYAQLFTPHSTAKEIRARIDRFFLKKRKNFGQDLIFLFYAFLCCTLVLFKRIAYHFKHHFVRSKIRGLFIEKRGLERICLKHTAVTLPCEGNGSASRAKLANLNDEVMLLYSDPGIRSNPITLKIENVYFTKPLRRKKRKSAVCRCVVQKTWEISGEKLKTATLVRYTPLTPLNHYKIQKYFLHESLAG